MNNVQLNVQELGDQLQLIRMSTECPQCGASTGDISGKTEFKCAYCDQQFKVAHIKEASRDHLSYLKLKEMADLQVSTATMSSRMDIQYDPKQFVDRQDASDEFNNFIKQQISQKKLFLLLGEAGFGKTWLAAHWANQLQTMGYPVFYIQLRDGIDSFFRLVFNSTRTPAILKINEALQEIDDKKP